VSHNYETIALIIQEYVMCIFVYNFFVCNYIFAMADPLRQSTECPHRVPRYAHVGLAQIVDLHPAVREMLTKQSVEYSPDLAALHPKVLLEVARAHPLGVVPVRGQQDRFHCVTGIRLYRRLHSLRTWSLPVPTLIYEKLVSKTIFALAQNDYYFAPYLAGPPASARHAHAAVWADAQGSGQLSPQLGLTGQAILAAIHNIDERPLHGKAQAHLRDSE
jgi:hypothetical protein